MTVIVISILMLTSVSASENLTDLSVNDGMHEELSIEESYADIDEIQNNYAETNEIQSINNNVETLNSVEPQFEYKQHVWSEGKYNISVILPEDCNGKGTFALYDKEFNCTIINGKGIIELPEFATITKNKEFYQMGRFNYIDDNNENYSSFTTLDFYMHTESPTDFNYIHQNNEKNFFIDDTYKTLIFELGSETGGVIDLYINNKFIESKENKNENYLHFYIPSNLSTGTYNYKAFLHDNLYYEDVNLTGTFNINAIYCNPDLGFDEGGQHVQIIQVGKNATGYVTISINNNEYSREFPKELLYDTYTKFSVFDKHEGTYNGTVTYSGDLNNPSITLPFFYYNKIRENDKKCFTFFAIKLENLYENEDHIVSIDLPKDAAGSLIVTADDNEYTEKLVNGSAKIIIPSSTSVNYIQGRYSARDYFVAMNGAYIITKPKLNISANDTKEGLYIKFSDNTEGCVKIDYENESYFGFVVNGETIIPNFHPIDTIVLSYAESDKVRSIKNQIIPVKNLEPESEVTIDASDSTVLYSAKNKYSVTVYGTDGKVATEEYVTFKIAGKQVAKVKTNSKGVASYVVTKSPGKYPISVTSLNITVEKTLTVKHIVTLKSVTVKKSAKKLVLTAQLTKVNKKYLKNKKVTFKFNGKKYTVKTNKKGVAKVSIKKASLEKLKIGKKVTYQATYLKDTVKKSAKVKK